AIDGYYAGGLDRDAAHPVSGDLGMLAERGFGHPVDVDARVADTFEPAFFDHVDAAFAVAVEEASHVGIGRPRACPVRAPWALTWEPESGRCRVSIARTRGSSVSAV